MKLLRFLNERAEESLGALMLAVMSVIAFLNVVVRYCTNLSFAWSEELTVNLFVWVVLLGTAAVFRERGHLGMNLLYDALPKKVRLACYLLALALGLAFFAALVWYGVLEIKDEIELEATSESLGIPVWIYTLATPLVSCLVIVRIAQRAWTDLRRGDY